MALADPQATRAGFSPKGRSSSVSIRPSVRLPVSGSTPPAPCTLLPKPLPVRALEPLAGLLRGGDGRGQMLVLGGGKGGGGRS